MLGAELWQEHADGWTWAVPRAGERKYTFETTGGGVDLADPEDLFEGMRGVGLTLRA